MTTTQGSTTELATRMEEHGGTLSAGKTLQDRVRELLPQIQMGLPPKTITPDRFVRLVLTEIRRTPELFNTTPESFLGAVMTAAQLGLEIGNGLGQVYLIPYKRECSLLIGYKGYIELAARGGIIIEAREVHENDEFDFEQGTNPFLHHKWKLGQERGGIVGYYGTARFPDGRSKFHVMDKDDIRKRQQRSQVRSDRGPWKTDPEAMARKTCIRAMVPQLPLTTELSRALEADEGVVTKHGEELRVHFPDAVEAEATEATEDPDKDVQAELEALLWTSEGAEDATAIGFLMRHYGPVPTLHGTELTDAIRDVQAFKAGKIDLGRQPIEDVIVLPTEIPEGGADEDEDEDEIPPEVFDTYTVEEIQAIETAVVTWVGRLKAPQVKEYYGYLAMDGDPPCPTTAGEARTELIRIAKRERMAGNPAALDAF